MYYVCSFWPVSHAIPFEYRPIPDTAQYHEVSPIPDIRYWYLTPPTYFQGVQDPQPVLKVAQETSRVSPAIRGRVPASQNFFIIFDLKMVSFGAFWVVFYVI